MNARTQGHHSAEPPPDRAELEARIAELGPWHQNIELAPGLSTYPGIGPSRHNHFQKVIKEMWPDGLAGKTFVDAACNAGGYCFWARNWGRQKCSASMCAGIFYHLPDPVTGLKLVADRTNDILVVSTGTLTPGGEEPEDVCLYSSHEGTESPMSGVYNLNWYPSGPRVLTNILNWMGFPELRLLRGIQKEDRPQDRNGRLTLVASRHKGLLANIKEGEPMEHSADAAGGRSKPSEDQRE